MPGLSRGAATPSFRAPRDSGGTPSGATTGASPPAPRPRLSATPVSFRAPRLGGASTDPRPSPSERNVAYPEPAGAHCDAATSSAISSRLSRLKNLDYHQPSALRPAAAPVLSDDEDAPPTEGSTAAVAAAVETAAAEPEKEEEEEEESAEGVISRLPPGPTTGNIYFQVQVEEASSRHDATGVVIIDTVAHAVQMFDRVGRQFGNRPNPGYGLKEADVARAKAGEALRVGPKQVLLVTALPEGAFRSGEFFLRTEHTQRKKEEKRKAKVQAAEAAATVGVVARKPKMSLGNGFGAVQFRKRPREGAGGFVVPVLGRIKGPKGAQGDLKALHDDSREQAVVLFRADYKRDLNGRPIVSVVVDPVIGDKLRPHQRIGVQFLYDCVTGERMPGYYGAILADEMGLGKTIQTVATIWTCLKQGKYGQPVARKCLVVAPSSLVRNWQNEFDKWLGEGAVKCMAIAESTPKGDRILSRFESEGDVLVISYDQLRKYVDRLKTVASIELVVCDEGHRLKNAEIKTSKAVDMLPTRRRIVLSGTPIQNDLQEFHAMVGFVNPGILGNTDLFRRVFEDPVMRGRDPLCEEEDKELGAERAHYLANLTQLFILRRTQSINEKYLPSKVDVTVFCRLGDDQRATYERIAAVSSRFSSAPLVLITALKKLCNHLDLLHEAITKERSQTNLPKSVLPKGFAPGKLTAASGAKMDFVSLMLDELVANGEQDKLVIVSNYTQTLDIIGRLCEAKRVGYFQLDGSTPIKKRQDLVDRFNVATQREIVFLLSSKAGGVGLNLVGANRLILFDPDWNPANDAQAMGRVWRDGQKKRVFIYRLLSTGTIEEKVYQRQVVKQGLSANVVDMKDDSKQHFSKDDLKALFTFRPDTLCDTHDLLGCRCLEQREPKAAGFKKVGEKRSGPRMDELKGWQHVADVAHFELDKVLRVIAGRRSKLLSFLFANAREAETLEADIAPERPFVQDEGAVTCSQQQRPSGHDARDEPEIEIIDSSDEEEEEEEEETSSDEDSDSD